MTRTIDDNIIVVDYRMKDDEIFKRIKIPTFVQLILQISEVQQQQQQNNDLNNHNSCSTPRNEG